MPPGGGDSDISGLVQVPSGISPKASAEAEAASQLLNPTSNAAAMSSSLADLLSGKVLHLRVVRASGVQVTPWGDVCKRHLVNISWE